MNINRYERKERLGHGAVRETARKVKCSEAVVSEVINDKAPDTALTRRVKVALARRLKMRVAEAFPPAGSAVQEDQTPVAA